MSNDKIVPFPLTLQRRDALELHAALAAAAPAIKGVTSHDLVIALRRTRLALRAVQDEVEEANTPTAAYTTFEQQRQALCEEYADRTDQGEARHDEQGNYVIDPARKPEFDTKAAALISASRTVIDEHRRRQREFPALLRAEIEVQAYRFPASLLPTKDLPLEIRDRLLVLFTEADQLGGLGPEGSQAAPAEQACA